MLSDTRWLDTPKWKPQEDTHVVYPLGRDNLRSLQSLATFEMLFFWRPGNEKFTRTMTIAVIHACNHNAVMPVHPCVIHTVLVSG